MVPMVSVSVKQVGDSEGLFTRYPGARGANNARQRDWCQLDQNWFFHWRSAANTPAGSLTRLPRYLFADSMTAGRFTRRNGLVARSRPIVEGNVGRFSRRRRASLASRSSSAELSGSTALANPMFARVYSCPQYTSVSSGNAASFWSDAYSCCGVPANTRAQPAANSVSPQNSMFEP